jgi:hypothetical protein
VVVHDITYLDTPDRSTDADTTADDKREPAALSTQR